jgi:presenilin-like A22 family membrane protease
MPLNVVENRQLLYIISMFLIVQFMGLLLATQVFAGASFIPSLSSQQSPYSTGGIIYLVFVIAAIAIFSIILVLLFRFVKTDKLFTLLEIWVVGAASLIFFLVLISSFSGNAFSVLFGSGPSWLVLGLALLCAGALVAAKLKWQKLRNMTAMVASVGAGLALGVSFPFWFALSFMAVLAVYDFIAVFITKHMVTLANAAVSRNLSLMIMASEVEAVPANYLVKSERLEYAKAKKEIYSKNPFIRPVIDSGMVPLSARTALGTGDLMAPLMLAVSAYTVYLNFTLSLVVVVGSVFGLSITMYTLKRYKRPLPAIPFLLFGIAVALGVFLLVSAI